MNDNDLRNTSHDDYRRLMAEAYPAPKKDIRAAVMAQIAAEAEQSQSDKKAKILTPAFRRRFVRYGSIAACFVLLVTLGFRVLPMMTKDAVMESESMINTTITAAYDADDACAADEAVPENGSGILKSKLSGSTSTAPAEEPAEAAPEEPAAVVNYSAVLTDSVMEEEVLEECVIEESPAEEAPAPEPEAEAPMIMMAPAPAAEDTAAEDTADSLSLAETAAETFEECVVEEAVEECIVEEEIEECVVEEAPAADYAVSPVSAFESELKAALIAETDAESYTAWMTGHNYTSPENWSIAEFVTAFGIPRERFTELYDSLTAFFAQTAPETEIPAYNLSELYPD